ncbi:energy transducer TonB [Massilia glaciei]|uniref:Energy transducer TonB n=2 Tax=Massilia glaciei TaxID=1524097 RepID=A0A2U2HPB8_9BURK|nr:energy transducer TonB [Massilia glaciei]
MPVYPKASLRNEETGTTSLQMLVAANGVVIDTKVFSSSGFRALDKAALAGLATCKFRPATINRKPVQGYGYMSFKWTLE